MNFPFDTPPRERTKRAVVMSEFALIFISLVLSLLVSLSREAGIEVSRTQEDAFLVLVVLDKLSGKNLFLISSFLFHDD